MFKNILLFCCVFVLVTFSAEAQKPKRNRVGLFTYTQYPLKPLPLSLKTYKFSMDLAYEDKYKRDLFEEKIVLSGYEKTKEDNFDFELFVDDYPIKRTETEGKKEECSEKVDGVVRKWNEYYFQCKITAKLKVKIIDKEGNVLYEKSALIDDIFKGPKSKSYREAEKSYYTAKSKYYEKIPNLLVDRINASLRSDILVIDRSDYMNLYKVKPKKHSYDDFDKAYECAQKAHQILFNDKTKKDEAFKIIKPAIEIWQNALKESDIKNRKARINKKVTMAAFFNIGEAYFVCGKFKEASDAYMNSKNYGSAASLSLRRAQDLAKRKEIYMQKQ